MGGVALGLLDEALAERFGMTWRLAESSRKPRMAVFVSKFDHCLADLLYRWRRGELPMEITAVVSNHPIETYANLDLSDVPFHHLPVKRSTKLEQEAAIWKLIQETETDLVVLARYMQVLSDGLAAKLERGFHHARQDLKPAKAFVVYSGEERYPVADGVEAISVREMATMLASL